MNTIAALISFLPLGDRDDDFRLGRPALWAVLTTDSVLTAFPFVGSLPAVIAETIGC